MSIGNANCLICGAPIVYAQEAHEVTCAICGKVEMGRCTCAEGETTQPKTSGLFFR